MLDALARVLCSVGLSIIFDMQEDKAVSLRIMNDTSATLRGRAVQVIFSSFELNYRLMFEEENMELAQCSEVLFNYL